MPEYITAITIAGIAIVLPTPDCKKPEATITRQKYYQLNVGCMTVSIKAPNTGECSIGCGPVMGNYSLKRLLR